MLSSERPRPVDVVVVESCRVPAAPAQCDDDCEADQSAAVEVQPLVWV